MAKSARAGKIRLSLFGLQPGQSVLDIGCSWGAIAQALARHGFTVFGLDYAGDLLRRGPYNNSSTGERTYFAVQGDALTLPFPDEVFDGATAIEVLEHLPDIDQAVAELRRVLRPGGRLCVGYPTIGTEKLFGRLNPWYYQDSTHPPSPRSLHALKSILTERGFRVEYVRGENFEWGMWGLYHNLLRSRLDHTGHLRNHEQADRYFWLVWRALVKTRLALPLVWVGNHLFPRSWYVYAVRE
jgi:Methylase involved in ubiquinone/menaquinone biosynthesis